MPEKGTKEPTTTAVVLVGLAILALTPPITDWYEGKPLPRLRTAILVVIAVALILLAVYPYLIQAPTPMISALRASLAPVTHSPWAWFVMFVLFWGYLVAGPLVDYYAERVAFHSAALSAQERGKYEKQLDHKQGEIGRAFVVERDQDEQIGQLKIELNSLHQRVRDAVNEIEKRDWIGDAVHAVAEIETAKLEQAQAHKKLETLQQEHPESPSFITATAADNSDRKVENTQRDLWQIRQELKAKLDSLLAPAN